MCEGHNVGREKSLRIELQSIPEIVVNLIASCHDLANRSQYVLSREPVAMIYQQLPKPHLVLNQHSVQNTVRKNLKSGKEICCAVTSRKVAGSDRRGSRRVAART